ncbi:MAG: beta-glucosidase [Frankiales bacterium]|nr:beta-glucosidase [Frankiales bacterium]
MFVRRRRASTRFTAGLAVLSLAALTAPAAATAAASSPAAQARAWLNADLSPEARAQLVFEQMTLAEKVDLMTGNQGEAPYAYYNAPIVRLGIPALKMADASAGVAPRGWSLVGTGEHATAMPSPQALAATWSLLATRAYAGVVADETRETGQNVLLGPDADIQRLPWWGRIDETESEDPILNADITSAYTQVVQSKNVIADLKHYAAYNQETNRGNGQNDIVDERTLREVYTLAFEAVVKQANVGSVMCSFNKINGEYSCDNAFTLRNVLKGRIGFTGFVLTDFGAIHDTLKGLAAGTDMETGTTTVYDGALLAAVQNGTAPISQVNESVLRILTTMFRIGLFDNAYTPSPIPVEAHNAVALATEEKAITLLKNGSKTLPLTGATKSITLIGADANILASPSGAPWVSPTQTTSVLQGITEAAKPYASVNWVPGNDPVNAANMLERPDMTAVPSSVLSPTSGSGHGLQAYYWHNTTFQGAPAVQRVENQVTYDAGFLSTFGSWAGQTSQVPTPPVNGPAEQQSVVYDGALTAPATGDYTFNLSGFGDATMSLAGQSLITMTGADARLASGTSAAVHLVAGSRYTVHITYQANHPFDSLEPGTLLLQWKTPTGALSPAIKAAAAAAAKTDVAIVYARTYEGEQRDRLSLKLPQSQDQLIAAVRATNPRTIVVLANSGPVTMPWLSSVPAVVESYFGGQAVGTAVAEVLWGRVNPTGKLPITYPRSETATPPGITSPWAGSTNLDVKYSEGLKVGYKGYQSAGITPLFPFGYGLSYTTYGYSGLHVSQAAGGKVTVTFNIKNTGSVRGSEVAQVYLGLPYSTGEPRRLVGFTRVTLTPGQTKQATVTIDPTDGTHPLGWFDPASQTWKTSPGQYHVHVGASSADIRMGASFTR